MPTSKDSTIKPERTTHSTPTDYRTPFYLQPKLFENPGFLSYLRERRFSECEFYYWPLKILLTPLFLLSHIAASFWEWVFPPLETLLAEKTITFADIRSYFNSQHFASLEPTEKKQALFCIIGTVYRKNDFEQLDILLRALYLSRERSEQLFGGAQSSPSGISLNLFQEIFLCSTAAFLHSRLQESPSHDSAHSFNRFLFMQKLTRLVAKMGLLEQWHFTQIPSHLGTEEIRTEERLQHFCTEHVRKADKFDVRASQHPLLFLQFPQISPLKVPADYRESLSTAVDGSIDSSLAPDFAPAPLDHYFPSYLTSFCERPLPPLSIADKPFENRFLPRDLIYLTMTALSYGSPLTASILLNPDLHSPSSRKMMESKSQVGYLLSMISLEQLIECCPGREDIEAVPNSLLAAFVSDFSVLQNSLILEKKFPALITLPLFYGQGYAKFLEENQGLLLSDFAEHFKDPELTSFVRTFKDTLSGFFENQLPHDIAVLNNRMRQITSEFNKLRDEKEAFSSEIDGLEWQRDNIAEQKRRLEEQLKTLESNMKSEAELGEEVAKLNETIATLTTRKNDLQQQLEQSSELLKSQQELLEKVQAEQQEKEQSLALLSQDKEMLLGDIEQERETLEELRENTSVLKESKIALENADSSPPPQPLSFGLDSPGNEQTQHNGQPYSGGQSKPRKRK